MLHTNKLNNDFEYEIIEKIGVLSTDTKGWTKEINLISYNGKPPLYDIRTYNPDGKMGKGVTLTAEAFGNLAKIIKEKY